MNQSFDSNPGITTWHNPLKVVQKCRIYVSPGHWVSFEVPPGESRQLSVEYDPAIQRINEDGVVVSGACPLLIRESGPPMWDVKGKPTAVVTPKIHESLDPANAERKNARERLAEIQLEEILAEKQARIADLQAKSTSQQDNRPQQNQGGRK